MNPDAGVVDHLGLTGGNEATSSRSRPRSSRQYEYEAVRVGGAQFLVATDHQDPEIEAVVMEDDRFVVVRVLVPSLARIVRESDPRS